MTSDLRIDQRVFDLYDEYCHGSIDRREFLARASALVIGGVAALSMAQALFPRYAEAQTIRQLARGCCCGSTGSRRSAARRCPGATGSRRSAGGCRCGSTVWRRPRRGW